MEVVYGLIQKVIYGYLVVFVVAVSFLCYELNLYKDYYSDLWRFDGNWTWIAGEAGSNQPGNYSEPKTPDPYAYPPSRAFCACFKDDNDHFWIFGGLNNEGKIIFPHI